MLKKVLIALGLVIFALICFVFYLINPFDAQYKTFDLEAKAQEAFKKDDMDAYVKYMNNPVTVKYHAPIGLYVTLITLGRYDEAEKAVKSFVRFKDYTACGPMTYPQRFMCRALDIIAPVKGPHIDKNKWMSVIYFEKGDYEKALEYNNKVKKQNDCYNVNLYSALGDFSKATKNLNDCEFEFLERTNIAILYRTRAYYNFKQKKYDEALKYLNKSLITPSENVAKFKGNNESYLLMAQVYTEMKQPEKAREYYERILKISPYNYKAKIGLDLLNNKSNKK